MLVLPGAKGAPIPTPKPTPKPDNNGGGGGRRRRRRRRSSRPSGPVHYNGGQFHWPVVGGGNYISQYFHYGHEALDIAADYGSHVVAAAGGRVIFAGWKSNGGGYQVWISHGGDLYTTYNHMSAITVGDGQSVGRGQQVGRVGPDRQRDRPAPPLRGLDRPGLERRHARQPAAVLLGRPQLAGPSRPRRRPGTPCDNRPDVPR